MRQLHHCGVLIPTSTATCLSKQWILRSSYKSVLSTKLRQSCCVNRLACMDRGLAHFFMKMTPAAPLTKAPSTTMQKTFSEPTRSMPLLHTPAVNGASLSLPSQFSANRKQDPFGVAASTFISGRWLGSVQPSLMSVMPVYSASSQYRPKSASTLWRASRNSLSRSELYPGPFYPCPYLPRRCVKRRQEGVLYSKQSLVRPVDAQPAIHECRSSPIQETQLLLAHLKTLKGMPASNTQSERAWSTPSLPDACRLSPMSVCWSPVRATICVLLPSAALRLLLFGRAWTRASISSNTSRLSLVSEKVHAFTPLGLPTKWS